jgi:Flp pilus assembly protein TadG
MKVMVWLAAGRLLRCLRVDTRGGLAITFAFSLPVVLAALGLASDYAVMVRIRTDLQDAADAAAVAAAREIPLARTSPEQITSAAQSFAAYALTGDSTSDAGALAASDIAVKAAVIDNFSAVKVDISEDWTPFFAQFLNSGVTPIKVTATARYVGSNNICVLGLSSSGRGVFLDRDSLLSADTCAVFSNSLASDSILVNSGASLTAKIICSSGGSSVASTGKASPAPVTDCPPVADPLASRPPPPVGGCDHHHYAIVGASVTLDPGVYCGGIIASGNSQIRLNPGTYVIKDGPLNVAGTSTLTGTEVGFFITGTVPGKLHFANGSHINLSAPLSGPMAGMLVFEDRGMPVKLTHRITSNDAQNLVGTIYLPVGNLLIDATKPVASQSAYTAIIAQHLELNSGPNLILNADYDTTKVPVPEGLKGSSQVILTQ